MFFSFSTVFFSFLLIVFFFFWAKEANEEIPVLIDLVTSHCWDSHPQNMADDLRVFFPVYELPEFFNNERACPCCFGLQKGDVRYILFLAIFCSFTAKLGVEKGVIPAVFCADTDYITSICVFLFAKAIGDVLHDFFLSFISNFGSSFSI